MFESIVANLLNRFLGSYIENFDPKQLNIGIWSGDVKLRNLRLKKESLDKFKLPVDVKFGHLGELTLQIPWSNLKSKPVRVIIEDVYLLAEPILKDEYNAEEEERRELEVKRERLKDLEAIEQATGQNEKLASDINGNESFMESLVTKIVDNLQVTIRNIHIRYEDFSVLTDNPYSIGLTLKELSAVSTDNDWVPSFIEITQLLTRKLLTLNSLTSYMNTDTTSIYEEDYELLLQRFKSTMESESLSDGLQYILKPVSGSGRLTVNKSGATATHPHAKAELFFDEFGLELDSKQYRDILWTASKFHWYMKTQKFRKFRPAVPVKENPKEWFRYAAKSILQEIHDKNYKWTWDYFSKRRDQRKAYVSVWGQKLSNKQLSEEEISTLERLEEELPYEDIKFYRYLTRNKLRNENVQERLSPVASPEEATNEKSSEAAATSNNGWFSWWSAPKQEDSKESTLDLQLSDDQRKALYDAIDYDEGKELRNAVDLPRDTVKFEILTSLKKGGIAIKHDKNSNVLTEVIFEGCNTQFYQRPDSFLTNFQLQEFRVEDGTGSTIYKHVVSVKQLHSHSHEDIKHSPEQSDPFFQVSFEHKPLDGSADSVLLAKLKSMTIFYNANFINEVIRFFTPPKVHLDTIGAIMNAAEAKMEGLTAQTRIGLQYALEEHKTINVKLDLQAPLIILPLDPTNSNSPVAILDAGHISVISNLVDKSKIEEIKAKESYTNEDWQQLNTLMYDQFNLHLQDAQFLVGPNFKSTMEELHNEDINKSATILNKLNIRLLLGISILPEAYNLAKFRIGGEVPKIHIAINDFQYKTIMQLIDILLPTFDSLDSDDSSIFDAFGHNENRIDDLTASSIESSPSSTNRELSEAAKNQHIFEFNLDVSLVKIALSRCIDGVTLEAENFVDLLGNTLHLHFFKTVNDMRLHLSLADINLIDHIEKSGIPEFEKLISSNNFKGDESVQSGKQLFQLDYKRTQRIVDFNGKEIEIFDQDIDMNIATVKFVISRKSILSMLNFALNTFTDPNAEPTPADELKHNDSKDDEISPQKINVNINLDSIIMVLNDDSMKLATLKLSTANIKVFLVPEEMEVYGKLGALTLRDEISTNSLNDNTIKNLISMEGDSLANFSYKTFDNETNSNPYNSIFTLETGAYTVNFVENSFRRIYGFLSKFQRMKAIYDRAREAAINQASQIEYSNNLKFELKIQTPTIIFPRVSGYNNSIHDNITANLGEFYAFNDFVEEGGSICNRISFGIQNTSMTSVFNYNGDVRQVSEMVKELDIAFSVDYFEDYMEDRPTINIVSKVPDVEMNLTEIQLNYLLKLSDSVSNILSSDDTGEALDDVEIDARNANAVVKHNSKLSPSPDGGESKIKNAGNKVVSSIQSNHPKVLFSFDLSKLSLTIYNKTEKLADLSSQSISCFSLNNIKIQFCLKQNDHFTADCTVRSFIVSDERTETTNKFREIIPEITHDGNQFILSASSDGSSSDKNITVMLTVDNPQTLIALDYLFEIQSFLNKGLVSNPNATNEQGKLPNIKTEESKTQSDKADVSKGKFGFSINIKEPTLKLLADSSKENTEALVFRVEQVLITSQNIVSLAANNIGMFLCTMDDFNTNYRIIDDFSISFALDSRDSSVNNYLTNVQLSIDPVLVRVSLRDIRLALSIFNKANDLYKDYQAASGSEEDIDENGSDSLSEAGSDQYKRLTDYVPNVTVGMSASTKENEEETDEIIIKGEEFNASFGGVRFVLIGDVHELPVLDMNLKSFEARAINWSTDLSAETHIESFINIYNYSRSTWEPLVEPWPVAVYVSRVAGPNFNIMIDIVSRKLAEVTVSSRSIALLSQMFSSILTEDGVMNRGGDSPYEIYNDTGFDLEVWIDHADGSKKNKTVIKNQEKISWAFESWKEVRQNLATETKEGVLAVSFVGDRYKEVHGISVTGEGEELYMLSPTVDNVHNRLACEVTLREDNIKTVRLKSTLSIQNDADVAIVIKLCGDTHASPENNIVVPSKGSKSLPLDCVFKGKIKIKPQLETEYEWSDKEIFWKDLINGGLSLRCNTFSSDDKSSYYFQAEASYDKDESLAKIYPHMNLIISAPLEIENLLPFDLTYRLYDKGARKDWSGKISKGVKSYVHVVSLEHLLLLSIEPLECGFGKSEFAIINTSIKSDFKRENIITLRNDDGQLLKLRIHYPRKSNTSSSLKVMIYSPYVILNRTLQDITINEKGNMLLSKGKSQFKSSPCMFSFDKHGDRKNRALLKINDSTWTNPLSFDAIGQSVTARAQIVSKQKEMNVGISVSEGEGKYNLTKVVTIAPRYVIKNTLKETIQIVEYGSTSLQNIEPNELLPLYGLRRLDKKSLLIKFAHSSKTWSSPFSIDDIGQLFIKVNKENEGQTLVKVNILLENATIYIQLDDSNNHWPFSIRNFSDSEFYIYQSNPNVNENGDIVKHDTDYKPIYYKVPPKSVMPYAYDYPNAIVKELVIRSHGRERSVNLSEIGNLKPFRLPPTQDVDQAIVDLNVIADGPVQSLVITNYDPSVSLYKLQGKGSSSTTNLSQTFEATENDENYFTKIITKFEGLGVSLINTRGQELCYITLRGLEVRYNESDLYQNLSVKLKWIQIDNQLYGGIFPIILYPTVVPKSGKEMNSHPSFSCAVCKVKDNNHGVLFIKYATVLLQEMTFEMDEDFLFALLDFAKVPGAIWNKDHVDKLCDDSLELTAPKSLNDSSDIYFEALHLQPTLLNLSFVRTERVNVEDKASSQNALMFFFNVLTMAIGNINDAPIKLNALFIENIRVPIPILMESIQTHYGQAFFYQVHKILGSADFLGNPVGLFNHISSGVLDIFYEPYQGFIINDRPQELGIGIAKGGLSFLKKSIFGFSDSFAKVTGSLAKGLSVVTLDKKFQERRRLNQRRNRPKHAMYGFATGANSFFESISSGVTGVATAPLEGANKEGTAGFFKGLGKGVVGLPTKTAIGFFDLASNVSEGIKNTTTVFDAEGLDKVRLPRYISHDNVIRPYSHREAQGQFWLKSIDGGIYFDEKYLAHLVLSGEENAILVTYRKIILVQLSQLKTIWVIAFDQIKSISIESTGINIGLKRREGPFIPIPERPNRNFLYNKIGIAVQEFNKHCQVVL